MKKIILVLFFFIFTIKVSYANTYSTEPQMFITELVNDALGKLSDKNLSKEDKKAFVEEIALVNVDINALGLYTLGELRKSTDKKSLEEYQKSFKKYFLKTLNSRLSDYSSNKFEVISAEKKSASYTIVRSRITENENQPEIKIDWRIYTKNPERPLIRDLIVEGLSLARAQKEEFNSILTSNNNDITILITKLEEFVNR
tara:strand:- start:45 stop:644 length:600 start_codon:yes stop_codon:yes gene_type:complete